MTVYYKATIVTRDKANTSRKSGLIHVKGDSLTFSCESYTVSFPLEHADIWLGGTANRTVFIKHPDHPSITLHTIDKSFLKECHHESFADDHSINDAAHSYRKHRRGFIAGIVFASLLICSSFYFLVIDRSHVVSMIVNKIPYDLEQSLGSMLFESYTTDSLLAEGDAVYDDLELLMKPVMMVAKRRIPFEVTVKISNDESINAFAMPGGFVVLHKGLIKKATSADEVLGVLAHELAHVEKRHSLQQMVGDIGTAIILSSLFGDFQGISGFITTHGSDLVSLSYSREHEIESDLIAIDYLIEAKINPEGLISFFERISNKNNVLEIPEFMSTHPLTKERISYAQNTIGTLSYTVDMEQSEALDEHFKRLQDKLF
ncbi:MAG: M48 family metallopeptidase [Rickettsiales bacterium]|nr:M48 family metallopeptidase [Rickettsiales bacterium]